MLMTLAFVSASAIERTKQNFNSGWLLYVGDAQGASSPKFDDSDWKRVTVPHAFNEDEAFKVAINELTDTIMWYRKHFTVSDVCDVKYFIEFEGIRQGGDCYLNGQLVGGSDNGVMAFGFDLTPYIVKGENVIAFRIDNRWTYRDRRHDSRFQWNDKNFNANYGGIVKNVWLHTTGLVYQTLPLYSNLETTGTYIYGTDYDIPKKSLTLNAEAQVRNESSRGLSLSLKVEVADLEGKKVAEFVGSPVMVASGEMSVLKASHPLSDVHFWSWGYGYLYTITTTLVSADAKLSGSDAVQTRTGFRKTRFGDGKFWLNDRVMMVHGFAQRTSNEWPAVGIDVPAWLSDYSNALQTECGGNVVRWMHITPSKQDIESCDRVGLLQAMPAGDAEKDVEGPRWLQRTEVMRDAIIYNRNNPSVIFYECGNESISRDHMIEMKSIRDKYDPYGGRAIGSREMLDIDEAEYGGEMLYINKSKKHPMWAMEYCRDEGLRKYWDSYSYPYHAEGDGPLYRGAPAPDYNHNMDEFVKTQVVRWNEFYAERPGTGKRVSSGGVKIIFSDTNTHFRGEVNYRTSGATDAMRIPKDAFYAFQAMWDGWVGPEEHHTHIVGHWNYADTIKKPVYVVSSGEKVELLLNGISLGYGERSHTFLFTFPEVAFKAGRLEAISYDASGKELSRASLETVGPAAQLKLTAIENPEGFKADGSDMALVQVEVLDAEGRRCPLDDRLISFTLSGEGEWRGGIALKKDSSLIQAADGRRGGDILDSSDTKNVSDNYILSSSLPVECGVNRVFVRSTTTPGPIVLTAKADGLPSATLTLTTIEPSSNERPSLTLPCNLSRGETPLSSSYKDLKTTIDISSAQAGSNASMVSNSYDDNELSQWESDGTKENAWVRYNLASKAAIDEITIKLTGWRNKCYPLAIYAGETLVWEGITDATLGYVHINIPNPVEADNYTIRMLAPTINSDAFGAVKELAGGNTSELDRFKTVKGEVKLRIVEIDFLEHTD